MKQILWVLSRILYFCKKYLLALAIVFLLSSGMYIGINFLNKLAVNELTSCVAKEKITINFLIYLGVYLIIWIISTFMGYLEAFANNVFRLKVDVLMQKMFMRKSIDTKQDEFFKTDFMDRYVFLSQNTSKASNFIFKIFTICFSNITIIASSAVIFIKYEPLLAVFLMAIMVVHMIATIVISKIQYSALKTQIKEERISNYLYGLFVDRSSAKEMRIYKFAKKIQATWNLNNQLYNEKKIEIDNKSVIIASFPSIINILIRYVTVVLMFIGMRDGRYDIGTFVMLFGLFNTCDQKVIELANGLFSSLFDEGNYFRDFYDFVYPISNNEIKEIVSDTDANNYKKIIFEKLELKNVGYKYPNSNENAIDNINLKIKSGEIVSILGYNGSGKTTLSKLILNAYDSKDGEILINDIPVEKFKKIDLFRIFGIAQQEFPRYSLSFKDNVRIGCVEKMDDDKEIERAYESSKLNEIFEKYNKKDNTIIGKEYDPEGIELSGGQWQKLEIASAYMGNPEILLLDEPTASIDPIHEEEMINDFRKNLAGKTAILISHRIGFAKLADRIVMLKDGKIIEVGTHKELLELDGYYSKMYKKQKSLYEN